MKKIIILIVTLAFTALAIGKTNKNQDDINKALKEAVYNRDLKAVQALRAAGAEAYSVMDSEIMYAAKMGYLNDVQVFAAAGTKLKVSDWDLRPTISFNRDCTIRRYRDILMNAAKKGYLEMIQALVTAGAKLKVDWNDEYIQELKAAIRSGSLRSAQALIALGINDLSKKKQGSFSSKSPYLDIGKSEIFYEMQFLYGKEETITPLMCAAENGKVEIVQALIAAGADVNAVDFDNKSVLMYAAENGKVEIVQALIAAGAKVNAVDSGNKSVLMYAAGGHTIASLSLNRGRVETVQALIAVGAKVNAVDSGNKSVLMYAAKNGKVETVQALIAAGAKVNAVDSGNKSVLMYAAENGRVETVQALIAAGANANATTLLGKTALNYGWNKYKIYKVLYPQTKGAWRQKYSQKRYTVPATALLTSAAAYLGYKNLPRKK